VSTRRHQPHKHQQPLATTVCATLFAGAIVAYMYFVCISVVHVVLQEEARQEVASLRSDIATLEREYIAAQHAVSERIAAEPGLIAVGEKVFLRRGGDSLVFAPAAP